MGGNTFSKGGAVACTCPHCGASIDCIGLPGEILSCPKCGRRSVLQKTGRAESPAIRSTPKAQPSSTSEAEGDLPPPPPRVSRQPSPQDSWRLRTPDGQEFGPITKRELDAWVAAGRVDASSEVLCHGWSQWRFASKVFPMLAAMETPKKPAAAYSGGGNSPGSRFNWVKHVRVVAVLLMVQGLLEFLFGLGCAFVAFGDVLLMQSEADDFNTRLGATLAADEVISISFFAGLFLMAGVFRIVVGVQNYRWRWRIMGFFGLGIAFLTIWIPFCAPTGIVLAIYGCIVYMQEDVAKAFRFRKGR